MNDHEGPRILYPSNSHPPHIFSREASVYQPQSSSPSEVSSTREVQVQTQSRQIPQQQQVQEGRENQESYQYNLIIDESGTRWMPIPEASPPLENTHFPVEKYSFSKQSREAKAGRGGCETREGILEIIEDEEPPVVILENKNSSLPLPSQLISFGSKDEGIGNQVPISAVSIGPRGVDITPLAFGGEKYREVPLRRGEVLGGQEGEGWGGDRYVAPYISRVKIHGKSMEDSLPTSPPFPAPQEINQHQETASTSTSVSASKDMSESRHDLMEMLKLLVSTQQQTLQVSISTSFLLNLLLTTPLQSSGTQ